MTEDRRLPLEGVWNFRDVGGYGTAGGRVVRRGVLFRSSRLSEVSDRDRDALSALDISTVCDLRRDVERSRRPSRLDFASPLAVVHAPAATPSTEGFERLLKAGEQRVAPYRALFVDSYRELASDNHAAWIAFLRALLEAPGATVVHCNAGQDRTGAAVAIVLSALGVARDVVTADYCLTATYGPPPDVDQMHRSMRAAGLDPPPPEVLIEILEPTAELLDVFLDAVERDHGSMDGYLRDALGMTDADTDALRARMLE